MTQRSENLILPAKLSMNSFNLTLFPFINYSFSLNPPSTSTYRVSRPCTEFVPTVSLRLNLHLIVYGVRWNYLYSEPLSTVRLYSYFSPFDRSRFQRRIAMFSTVLTFLHLLKPRNCFGLRLCHKKLGDWPNTN